MSALNNSASATTYPPVVEKGTISISIVAEAVVCLKERGIDADELLNRAGISPQLLLSPHSRVSASNFGTLWQLIAETIGDEFFGMDSHPMKPGSFTMLCHAVVHSDTLERALKRTLRFLNLLIDDIQGHLERDGDIARIVLHEVRGPKRAFAYAGLLVILHGLSCWMIGRRIPLLGGDFFFPEPEFSNDWRVLFSPNLRFNQPETIVSFPAEYLDLATVQNERTMKEFLRSAPANFLVKYRNSESQSAQIRRQLRKLPPDTWPDFDTLARQLHTSPSTLRRRLEEEGQSYLAIKNDLRCDLAISCLSHSGMNVTEIANTLGFAETSAFHRAFKKWTGASPGEYRRVLSTV